VDAADGVLDGAAAALPEGGLAELLGDAGGLVGALADQVRAEQLDAGGDEGLARHAAAEADEALVGDDLDEGVEVFLALVALRPAAVDGAAGEAGDADVGDLHSGCPRDSRRRGPGTSVAFVCLIRFSPSTSTMRGVWRRASPSSNCVYVATMMTSPTFAR